MKTNWEIQLGDRTSYVELHTHTVLMGEHHGTAASDGAGTCTFVEFLQGRFQDTIATDFGSAVLAEIVAEVQARLAPGRRTDDA